VDGFEPSMLDMLCLAGEVAWARLSSPRGSGGAQPIVDPPRLASGTPIALFLREHATAWLSLRQKNEDGEPRLSDNARVVLDFLRARGASFFDDLRIACGLDREDARQAIGLLAAAGLASSDGFSGLRALVWSSRGRAATTDRRANFAGRWTAIACPDGIDRDAAVERQAWSLLRRYGVVFRRLLAREANAAPWRDLARVYRRLEARGEIRGGRFVSGMSGEQFALPLAVERLREVRRTANDGRVLAISAADPLNLAGIITAGDRIRATGRTRIVYRDGVPLAVREGDVVRELVPIDPAAATDVARALRRQRATAVVR
jgi:ATP-dependent Lhr-like helicase